MGGRNIPLTAQTEITHESGVWRMNANMVLLDSSGTIFSCRYEISPPPSENGPASWSAFATPHGRLKGTFTVEGDTIMSSYASEDGEFTGAEGITRINENEYRMEGRQQTHGEITGSWTANLRRAPVRLDPDMMVLPVTEADIDAVHRVMVETWHDTYNGILSPEVIQFADALWFDPPVLWKSVEDPDVFLGKAVLSSGTVAGVIILKRYTETGVVVGRVYVLPAFQRQGIGSMLLREGLRRFPGARVIRLEIEEHNTKAITFYQKQGFTTMYGTREILGSDGITIVIMEKTLS